MPLTIRYLFQVAEAHLSQHARQLRVMGLLPWTVLGCLIYGLEDLDTLEQMSGLALDRGAKDRLSLLAECLQATMGIQLKVLLLLLVNTTISTITTIILYLDDLLCARQGVPKPTVQKVTQVLEEKRPKWINMQLQKARKLCSDR